MASTAWTQLTRSREASRITGTAIFDWTYVVLLLLLTIGVYLDGWSHNSFGPDQSLFSEYHLLFYTSVAIIGTLLFVGVVQAVRRGARGLAALPRGYLLSVIGVFLFGVGGVIDLTGHALFGFEVLLEAILSPSHMLLFLAWALIALGPVRAAVLRERAGVQGGSLLAMLPAVLAWAAFTNVLFFGGMTFMPTVTMPWMLVDHRTEIAYFGENLGVLGVIVESLVIVGATLWLLRSFRKLPLGTFTIYFAVLGILTSIVQQQQFFVPMMLFTGVVADFLYASLRPGTGRPLAQHLFAALVPLTLWASIFVAASVFKLDGGLWYSPYVLAGTLVHSAVVGVLLSLLVAQQPAPAKEPARGARS